MIGHIDVCQEKLRRGGCRKDTDIMDGGIVQSGMLRIDLNSNQWLPAKKAALGDFH